MPSSITEYINVCFGIQEKGNGDQYGGEGFVEITKLGSHPLYGAKLYYKLHFDKGLVPYDAYLVTDQTEIVVLSASDDGNGNANYYITRYCIDESTYCNRMYLSDTSLTYPVTSKV